MDLTEAEKTALIDLINQVQFNVANAALGVTLAGVLAKLTADVVVTGVGSTNADLPVV